MQATSSACDPARLKRLLDNGLEPAEETETVRHLDGCAPCQKAIETMAAESGLWSDARHLDELWNLEPGGKPRPAAADEDGAHDFLEPSDRPEVLGMLGSHEVLRVLGRGGMGVVFQAFDPALSRLVAIKVLAPELSTSGMARRRFAREAQATAAIVHDHVIAIHAVEANARLPYLVMQYVPGHSLQERIDRAGPLALTEVLRIGMQVASGLAAAHAQGVIHRDIKPANILLENGVERVKITDFGLARALDDASLTQSGVISGTPQYMAPEQARGEPVDHRADLFSLGSLLYTMCTGRSPFRAETTLAVLRRVVEDEPRPIRAVNPDVPRWLESIVARLHAKDPADRFGSASEVAELLGHCLAHVQQPDTVALPVDSTKMNSAPRRPVVRRTFAAAVGLALLAGLGAGEATGVTRLADAVVSVLRIRTDEGTLLVEIGDPEIKVSVDDKDLVIHGAGLQEVRLRPGVHKFRTRAPGGSETTELIEITRGGARLARVSREPEPTKVLEPGAKGPGRDTHSHAISAQPAAREADPEFLKMFSLLIDAKKKRDQARRLTRNPMDPFLKKSENNFNHVLEEIGRRWPAEVREMERTEILKKVAEYQAELEARQQTLPAVRELMTQLESMRGELALLMRNDPRLDDLDLDTLRQRLKEAIDRRDDARRLRTAADPRNVSLEQEVKSLQEQIQKRFPYTGWRENSPKDEVAGSPAAPATLDELKGRPVLSLAFSPDCKTLATAGAATWHTSLQDPPNTGELFLWDIRTGRLRSSATSAGPVLSVAFSPDGRTIATAGQVPLTLREVQSGRILNSILEARTQNQVVDFSPDGRTIATAGVHGVTLWDGRSARKLRSLESPSRFVCSVDFAPDGKSLLSSADDGMVRHWNVATGRLLQEFKAHDGFVFCVAFAPAGEVAATTGNDKTVKLWNLAEGRELATLEGHTEPVLRAAFSPDGKTLASCSARAFRTDPGGEVILWDVASRSRRLTLDHGNERHTTVAFSPDGTMLATATLQGMIRLWDVRGEKPVPFAPGANADPFAPAQGLLPALPEGAVDLFSFSIGVFY